MELPKEFIDYTSSLFGEERWKNYLASFEEAVPVSVRLNPFKTPLQLTHTPMLSTSDLPKGGLGWGLLIFYRCRATVGA